MVPLSEIGISCWPLFGPMFARVFYFVIENLNSRTLVDQEAIGRATIHSIGRVTGVSPFSAATHPHNECCRGMAWWDVLAAKWLALLTRIGELVVRPLSLPPGADGLTGSSPLLLFGHDGLTGSSPSLLLAGA